MGTRPIRTAFVLALLTFGTAAAESQNPRNQFSDLLRTDHAAIMAAIERVESAAPDARQRNLKQVENALIPHMDAEEASFYTALARVPGGERAADAARLHQEAAKVLRGIMRMPPDDPDAADQVARLKQMLQAHMKLEEKTFLQFAQENLSDQEMQRILVDYQRGKRYSEDIFKGR